MATLKDIALRLGVSIRAVSYAVNGTGRLGAETRKRICEAAAEMGYAPNAAARSLVTKRSFLIGVIVPFLSDSFFSEIITGIDATVQEKNFTLLLLNQPPGIASYRKALLRMRQRNVDGLILYPTPAGIELAELIRGFQIPVIQIMNHNPALGPHFVVVDNRGAARQAVGCLIDSGRRTIAMLAHNRVSPEVAERCRGYAEELAERLPGTVPIVRESPLDEAGACECTRALLAENPAVDAIFAASDIAALGVLKAALALGKQVPDELSVIGFDDLEIAARQLVYPLSTVAQPKEVIGTIAGKMMLRLLAGKTVENQILQAPPVLRSTTGRMEQLRATSE